MPKLSGPMFSLGASGTFGGLITYYQRGTDARCRVRVDPPDPNTALQAAHRTKISQMAATWDSLPLPTQQAWGAYALPLGLIGYTAFWRQWFLQGSTPQNPPSIP